MPCLHGMGIINTDTGLNEKIDFYKFGHKEVVKCKYVCVNVCAYVPVCLGCDLKQNFANPSRCNYPKGSQDTSKPLIFRHIH